MSQQVTAADLVAALEKFVKKVDAVHKATGPIFLHAANHRMPYNGPTFVENVKEAQELLARFKAQQEDKPCPKP